MSETGLLGLILLILFWILCLVILLKAYNKTVDFFEKKSYLCGLVSIVALLVLSFTENYFSATTVMVCVSVVVSMSTGLSWQEDFKKIEDLTYKKDFNFNNKFTILKNSS